MPSPTPRRFNSLFGNRVKKQKPRRAEGVSRRRKKQFSFESLEDRRLMTATPYTAPYTDTVNLGSATTPQTYSSATLDGQFQILMRELYWQAQIAAAQTQGVTNVVNSIPTDPLVPFQWHLINTGQQVGNPDYQPIYGVPGEDINVAPAWAKGYTGRGVTVAVVDSGTQLLHPDLVGNVNFDLAFDAISQNGSGDPAFQNPTNAHGTAVAGLIASVANNGIGGAGVAHGATLVPIRIIDAGQTEQGFIDTFRHAIQDIDITNNSWGPGVTRGLSGPTLNEFTALRDSIQFGRAGKGVIHVFAAGNDAGPSFNQGFTSIGGWDSTSYNGWASSRYTIGVTGVDHDGFYNNVDGTITVYPELGPSVLVAAPTGSNAGPVITDTRGIGSGLYTTDVTGDLGFNALPDPINGEVRDPFFPFDRDFLADPDYTSRMNGTSGAAPLVSGVIALMLEANPELTWRDVQEILVRSARQNAEFGIPQNGQGQATNTGTQNTWIVNQTPVFHDPDLFSPTIPVAPFLRTLSPTLDPNQFGVINGIFGTLTSDHYAPTPHVLTNGAGYTVSQGIGFYGEQFGYAHGVVDADMAVTLAEQWHTKNQALSPELTYTSYVQDPGFGNALNIPAAERGSDESGNQIVPGGIGGAVGGGFIALWNEYFDATPFDDPDQTFPYRGDSSIEIKVPDNNAMTVETVEVRLSLEGGTAEALDHLRILLVSPDGTHSELNNFWVEPPVRPFTFQLDDPNLSRAIVYGQPGSVDTAPGSNLVWTFSTKRSWGERSNDSIVFDPTTGLPVVDQTGFFGDVDSLPGQALKQGWRVVIENYDFDTAFGLAGLEVAFHGNPIDANTQRIQGLVGVDENRDDLFNFSRVIQQIVEIDNDPTTMRLGEVVNQVDLTQEAFAGNVTVTARRASDGEVVAQFVTGADGNFYFDLVPDDYIISAEDAKGRLAQEDSTTASGILQKYDTEWRITPEHFRAWSKVQGNPNDTPVDANGVPTPWLDANGETQVHGMKGINFLLDPGNPPAPQATFTGTIYADTNGDGQFNSVDVAMPGITVFGDVNRNGQRDAGEVTAVTNAQGQYSMTVTGINAARVLNIGVVRPVSWTSTNDGPSTNDSPTDGLESFFVQPGASIGGVDFAISPPATNNAGASGSQPGIILGSVFEDVNGNQVRDAAEKSAPGFTVFIDANSNGVLDAGDTSTVTNANGAYVFTNVAAGQRTIRLQAFSPNIQTTPANNAPRIVQLLGSGTFSNVVFGVQNTAVLDFGDLPDIYGTTGGNAARHRKGVYFLGGRVDGELNGQPTVGANGDDLSGMPDDDGVTFGTLTPGSQAQVTVVASRNNGYLQGWIDWNDNGVFEASEQVFSNVLLNGPSPANPAGVNQLLVNVPADAKPQVYARFRYSNFGLGLSGEATVGEVEDYRLTVAVPQLPLITGIPADFDQDNDVDGADFLRWQRNAGRPGVPTQAQGNANGDLHTNGQDLAEWKQDFGTVVASAALVAESSDYDNDQDVDGHDFLAWQLGVGGATGLGDGNGDGQANGNDLGIWREQFSAVATATPSAAAVDSPSLAPASLRSVGDNGGSAGASTGLAARSAAAAADVRAELFAGRPFANLADKLGDKLGGVAERVRTIAENFDARGGKVSDAARTALDRVADRLAEVDGDFMRQDRAFADLFGSRRRQGLRAEFDLDVADEEGEVADEAFAAVANHFEWRLR